MLGAAGLHAIADVFEIISIMIGMFDKFRIKSLQRRVGLVIYGVIVWLCLGEISNAINFKEMRQFYNVKVNKKFANRGRTWKGLYRHINHKGGSPMRDFYVYIPYFIFKYEFAGAALGECHEEGSFWFQNLHPWRATKKTRVPYQALVYGFDELQLLREVCKQKRWEKSVYFDKKEFDMKDIRIDFSFFEEYPRLIPQMIKSIKMMQTIASRDFGKNIYGCFVFYDDGSLKVNCGNSTEIILLSMNGLINAAPGTKACKFEEWENIVKRVRR